MFIAFFRNKSFVLIVANLYEKCNGQLFVPILTLFQLQLEAKQLSVWFLRCAALTNVNAIEAAAATWDFNAPSSHSLTHYRGHESYLKTCSEDSY